MFEPTHQSDGPRGTRKAYAAIVLPRYVIRPSSRAGSCATTCTEHSNLFEASTVSRRSLTQIFRSLLNHSYGHTRRLLNVTGRAREASGANGRPTEGTIAAAATPARTRRRGLTRLLV